MFGRKAKEWPQPTQVVRARIEAKLDRVEALYESLALRVAKLETAVRMMPPQEIRPRVPQNGAVTNEKPSISKKLLTALDRLHKATFRPSGATSDGQVGSICAKLGQLDVKLEQLDAKIECIFEAKSPQSPW